MSKELNPSPKIPSGKADEQIITKTLGVDYGTLSPNPNYTDGYIDGGRGVGTPTNPNQEPKKQAIIQPGTIDAEEIGRIARAACFNFIDLTPYGVVDPDVPNFSLNITSGELYDLIDAIYDPNKITVVKFKYVDALVTCSDTVIQNSLDNVPSYEIYAGFFDPQETDAGFVFCIECKKDSDSVVIPIVAKR